MLTKVTDRLTLNLDKIEGMFLAEVPQQAGEKHYAVQFVLRDYPGAVNTEIFQSFIEASELLERVEYAIGVLKLESKPVTATQVAAAEKTPEPEVVSTGADQSQEQ